ncbi:MAG: aspartate/glutamate racemase family protein [Pseudomonadota bacterium]
MTERQGKGGDIHMKAVGGKSIYGASLGILMLETRFPRIPGDIGNAGSWPFPVLFKVVPQASPDRVVVRGAEGLLPAFIEAGKELVRLGADGITTSCGFLSLFQDELAEALDVPVATSSLMQVPLIERTLPAGKRVGILTVSGDSFSEAHLTAAGVDPSTPVMGAEGGREFSRVMLNNEELIDVDLAREDNISAARQLVEAHPEVAAIVLECTNMVPFAADIRDATGRSVFSIYSFATWFHSGLTPRRF